MLLRHIAWYLADRGLASGFNLLAIVAYTRLLTSEEFGRYALVIAGVGLANAVAFQWLCLGVLRFLPLQERPRRVFLSTVAASFLALVGLSGLGAVGGLAVTDDPILRRLLILATVLLWVQALFELHLHLARSQLLPRRYAAMSSAKALLAAGLGMSFAWFGFGASGLLLGLILGMLAVVIYPTVRGNRQFRLRSSDAAVAWQLVGYGAPLVATFALQFVVASSDRFLIGWLLSEDAVGRYAVSYDLADQSIRMLMMIVNLAAYPLAVRALQEFGPEAARRQLGLQLNLLLLVALPATVGLALIAENVAGTVIGQAFRQEAAALLRLVAWATLLSGLQAYYANLSFQLGQRTMFQVWIAAAAAAVNFSLNLWWIPLLGVAGAAYATMVAYAIALVASLACGTRVFRLPGPDLDSVKIAVATVAMAAFLWHLPAGQGLAWLAVQVAVGIVTCGAAVCLLDVAHCRTRLVQAVRPWRVLARSSRPRNRSQ
jgi:O-antigen/teichoic acid export membrane protein